MSLSRAQQDLLSQLKASLEKGLTTDEASARREADGSFNVVTPPINCPSWVCCLLPCIKHVPSMKAFAQIKPEDAEVKRNGKWIRYDAASLVTGDVIRLEEGDIVPADCVVLLLGDGETHSKKKKKKKSTAAPVVELLVDHRLVTGEDKPRSSAPVTSDPSSSEPVTQAQPIQLYWGGRVVQGSAVAVVNAVGAKTFVASLIKEGRFPPTDSMLLLVPNDDRDGDEEVGISLISNSGKGMTGGVV